MNTVADVLENILDCVHEPHRLVDVGRLRLAGERHVTDDVTERRPITYDDADGDFRSPDWSTQGQLTGHLELDHVDAG